MNYRIHCMNTMKVYFDLKEKIDSHETDDEVLKYPKFFSLVIKYCTVRR